MMDKRVSEHDEFLLSQLLDGDLPPDEATALHDRMEREPALRDAFASLARVNAALERRRRDRPEIDWGKFHANVMDAVEAEAASPPAAIRWVRWIRIGVPLAAAAAIVLLVSVDPFGPETAEPGRKPGGGPVLNDGQGGQLVVQIERPGPGETQETGAIEVAFTRAARLEPGGVEGSDEAIQVAFLQSERLQEAIEKEDEANRRRTGIVIAIASSSLPGGVAPEFMEEPPL